MRATKVDQLSIAAYSAGIALITDQKSESSMALQRIKTIDRKE